MYNLLKSTHSYFAWLALGAIIFAIVTALISILANKQYNQTNFKTAFWGLIAGHIQLLVGLVLYFISPNGFQNLSGETMKDSFSRLLAVEHPFVNILAIIIITIGYSKAKKALNTGNPGKTVLVFYGIGLVLLLSRIPWNSWLNI